MFPYDKVFAIFKLWVSSGFFSQHFRVKKFMTLYMLNYKNVSEFNARLAVNHRLILSMFTIPLTLANSAQADLDYASGIKFQPIVSVNQCEKRERDEFPYTSTTT